MDRKHSGYHVGDQLELADLLLWILLAWDTPCVKRIRLQKVWGFILHALRRDKRHQEFPKIRSKEHPDHLDGAILVLESIGFFEKDRHAPDLICLDIDPHTKRTLKRETPQLIREIGSISLALSQGKTSLRQALMELRALREKSPLSIPA